MYALDISTHMLIGSILIMAGNCRHAGGCYHEDNTRLHTYWTSAKYLINTTSNVYMDKLKHQPILYAIYNGDINRSNLNTAISSTHFNQHYRHIQHKYDYNHIKLLVDELHGKVGDLRKEVFKQWQISRGIYTSNTDTVNDTEHVYIPTQLIVT